jgi:hypothetical protein
VGVPADRRLSFSQLSVGLQIIVVIILIGSCSGASNNDIVQDSATSSEVQALSDEVRMLEREIRRLRRDVARRGG